MSAKKGKGEAPEVRRIVEEDIHYHVQGVTLHRLVKDGLISAILKMDPATEVKGLLLGKRAKDKFVSLTETTVEGKGKIITMRSLDLEDTKPLKTIVRAIEEVAK